MDAEQLKRASARGRQFLLKRLCADGSYGVEIDDIAAYYKSPTLYLRAGLAEEADRVLSRIKQQYLTPGGSFAPTSDPALSQYGSYIGGWIAMGAQRAGRFDIARPASAYLDSFYKEGHFSTLAPGDAQSDVLTAAHLGLHALYTGQESKARAAGKVLQKALDQSRESGTFYLRFTADGPVKDYPEDGAFLFALDSTKPQQGFFMVGYPLAFLCLLYRATAEDSFLETAQHYFDFLFGCQGVDAFHFSHKVAWGASMLTNLTGEQRPRGLCEQIVSHLLSIQVEDGGWHDGQPEVFRLDQTAEICLWLEEVALELAGATR